MIVNIILIILAILASILGILLSLLLLFLFVPIRYRGKVSKYEAVDGDVSIGWLFSVLYGKIEYHNEKLNIVFRIFGYPIRNNQEKKPKKIKAKKQKKEMKNLEVKVELAQKQEQEEVPPEQIPPRQIPPRQIPPRRKEIEDTRQSNRFQRFFGGLAKKIRSAIRSIPETLRRIWNVIKQIFRNLDRIKEFFQTESNQQGIKSIWNTVKRILKHLKPGRCKLSLRFGFDDPSITGQVLGGAAILYAKLGNQLNIVPDFENEVLEGQLELKGRIRIGTLLYYSVLLLIKPEFRQLLKNFKHLKEEL